MVPRSILRFHLWNLQYLLFNKLPEGLIVFSCKNGLLNCYSLPILCPDSQTSQAFFLKSIFHQSVITSSMKLPECNVRFRKKQNKKQTPKK